MDVVRSAERSPGSDAIRRTAKVPASEELPDWLPDGWIMEVRRRKDGRADKYYTSPVSGHTFRSAAAVMTYLNFGKDGYAIPDDTTCLMENIHENKALEEVYIVDKVDSSKSQRLDWSEDDGDILLNQHGSFFDDSILAIQSQPTSYDIICKDSPQFDLEALLGWIPKGWIIEIRVRLNEGRGRRRYKCYFDPMTRYRFYSKEDVLYYLKTGKACNFTYEWELDETDMILSRIQYTPEGFPAGWIKEMKIRVNASGTRKDPYYTDSATGYVFRTKKDVVHFLETGELSRHATKPKVIKVINKLIKTRESNPPAMARSLAVQPPEIVPECLCAPLPCPVDKMLDGDAPIENSKLLLPSSGEVADLKTLPLTLTNDTEQSNILDENGRCTPTTLGNGKLSLSQEQSQTRLENDFSVDGNDITTPNVVRKNALLVNLELRHGNIRALKSAARELPHLAKARQSMSDSPSDKYVQKPRIHKTKKNQVASDNKSSTVSNGRLDPQHTEFSRSETFCNQWEFLATTANNLANPMSLRSPLAKQPRLYKKLAVRKPSHKTASINEISGAFSNTFSTGVQDNPVSVHPSIMVLNALSRPAKLPPSVEQLNTPPVNAIPRQPQGTASELRKEKPSPQRVPTHSQTMLPRMPKCTPNHFWLKPENEILHQPVKLAVVFSSDKLPEARNEPLKETVDGSYKTLDDYSVIDSNKPVSRELPSDMVAISYKPTHIPLGFAEKLPPENVNEYLPLNLQVVIAPSDISSKSITEVTMENMAECIEEVLLTPINEGCTLPLEIHQTECTLVKEQLEMESKIPFPPSDGENQKMNSNLSNTIEKDLPMPSAAEPVYVAGSLSEVLQESPNKNLPTEKASAQLVPPDVINSFPSKTVPELINETAMDQGKEKMRLSTQPINEPKCVNSMATPTPIGESCELEGNGMNEPSLSNLPETSCSESALPTNMELDMPSGFNIISKQVDKQPSSKGDKTKDTKSRKLRMASLINDTNIIQVPRRSRSPLTRSKSKTPRRTSTRLSDTQPVKPIITYKRKRQRTN